KKFALLIGCFVIVASCSHLRYARNESVYKSLKYNPQEAPVTKSFNKEYLPIFFQEICLGSNDEKCKNEIFKTLKARFEQTYIGARPEAIIKSCEAHPVECRRPESLEKIYIAAHNKSA